MWTVGSGREQREAAPTTGGAAAAHGDGGRDPGPVQHGHKPYYPEPTVQTPLETACSMFFSAASLVATSLAVCSMALAALWLLLYPITNLERMPVVVHHTLNHAAWTEGEEGTLVLLLTLWQLGFQAMVSYMNYTVLRTKVAVQMLSPGSQADAPSPAAPTGASGDAGGRYPRTAGMHDDRRWNVSSETLPVREMSRRITADKIDFVLEGRTMLRRSAFDECWDPRKIAMAPQHNRRKRRRPSLIRAFFRDWKSFNWSSLSLHSVLQLASLLGGSLTASVVWHAWSAYCRHAAADSGLDTADPSRPIIFGYHSRGPPNAVFFISLPVAIDIGSTVFRWTVVRLIYQPVIAVSSSASGPSSGGGLPLNATCLAAGIRLRRALRNAREWLEDCSCFTAETLSRIAGTVGAHVLTFIIGPCLQAMPILMLLWASSVFGPTVIDIGGDPAKVKTQVAQVITLGILLPVMRDVCVRLRVHCCIAMVTKGISGLESLEETMHTSNGNSKQTCSSLRVNAVDEEEEELALRYIDEVWAKVQDGQSRIRMMLLISTELTYALAYYYILFSKALLLPSIVAGVAAFSLALYRNAVAPIIPPQLLVKPELSAVPVSQATLASPEGTVVHGPSLKLLSSADHLDVNAAPQGIDGSPAGSIRSDAALLGHLPCADDPFSHAKTGPRSPPALHGRDQGRTDVSVTRETVFSVDADGRPRKNSAALVVFPAEGLASPMPDAAANAASAGIHDSISFERWSAAAELSSIALACASALTTTAENASQAVDILASAAIQAAFTLLSAAAVHFYHLRPPRGGCRGDAAGGAARQVASTVENVINRHLELRRRWTIRGAYWRGLAGLMVVSTNSLVLLWFVLLAAYHDRSSCGIPMGKMAASLAC